MSQITELMDLEIERLDGVDGPANGTPFLMIKALPTEGGLEPEADDDQSNTHAAVAQARLVAEGGQDFPDAAGIFKADGDMETVAEDMAEPGSAAWELEDANRFAQAAMNIVRIKMALCESREREAAEVSTGASTDWVHVIKLDDAVELLGSALGIVAALAFHEAGEAEAGHGSEAVSKSRLTADHITSITSELDVITSLLKSEGHGEEIAMTPEQIEKMIDDKVAERLATPVEKSVDDSVVDEVVEPVEKSVDEQAPELAAVTAPAPVSTEDLVKALEPLITQAAATGADAIKDLTARLETVEKMAAPPRAIGGPVAPGSGLSDVQAAFAKAASATDPVESDLLHQEATRLALATAFRQS